ncbi:MAG: diaminopimelate decarboxylase [Acidobacteriota bacterium]
MKYFDLNHRPLQIGPFTAEQLVAKYGTPLYVYDGNIIERKYSVLRTALPAVVDIFYALKSNSALAIAVLLKRLGAGCEIASQGELETALRAGFEPANIIFAGPGKRDEEIATAIRSGIYTLNVESIGELRRANALAAAQNRVMPVELRISTGFSLEESVSIIGGSAPKKFGIDIAEIETACQEALALPNITLSGFHVFNASQVLDWEIYAENAGKVVTIAADLARRFNFPLRSLDIGGGLGTPYMPEESEFDIEKFATQFANLLKETFGEHIPRVIIEPGRYLSGECGIFLTTVIDKKRAGDKDFLITDGGIHQLLRPALIKQNHYLINCSKPSVQTGTVYQIAGPLCTGLDFLARDIALANVEVGDLLAIFNAGAYGYSESMPFFLSHPIPPEVLVYSGKEALIRPRIKPQEYLANQRVPDFLQ